MAHSDLQHQIILLSGSIVIQRNTLPVVVLIMSNQQRMIIDKRHWETNFNQRLSASRILIRESLEVLNASKPARTQRCFSLDVNALSLANASINTPLGKLRINRGYI
jgi:hypothetical protein